MLTILYVLYRSCVASTKRQFYPSGNQSLMSHLHPMSLAFKKYESRHRMTRTIRHVATLRTEKSNWVCSPKVNGSSFLRATGQFAWLQLQDPMRLAEVRVSNTSAFSFSILSVWILGFQGSSRKHTRRGRHSIVYINVSSSTYAWKERLPAGGGGVSQSQDYRFTSVEHSEGLKHRKIYIQGKENPEHPRLHDEHLLLVASGHQEKRRSIAS